jgi:predicted Zn-dependent peptidase
MINRSKIPLPSKEFSFLIPEIQLLKLNNGLEIYHVRKENLPIVQFSFISFAGSVNDPVDKYGSGFLTSLLIDEGAAEYDALQLNNELEKLGTISTININHDIFILGILSLKENFERSLQLFSKIIFEPRFEQKDFDREKKKVLDKILQLKDEPSYIASTNFEKLVLANSEYSNPEIGNSNSVNNISLVDIKNYYTNNFLQLSAKVIIVGNISENETLELSNKYFAQWKSINKSNDKEKNILTRPKKSIYLIHKKESAQTELRIGHLSKNRFADDYYSSKVMNTILGGQFSSRINLNLREKKGFTYGAGSSFHYNLKFGYLEVSTAVNIQNTSEAISEILFEMEEIKKNISQSEVDFAKSYLIKQFPSKFETYSQISKNISPLILYSLPIDYYKGYTARIDSVELNDVIQSAYENIFPENIIILAVGDRNNIIPQISKNFDCETIELDLDGLKIS